MLPRIVVEHTDSKAGLARHIKEIASSLDLENLPETPLTEVQLEMLRDVSRLGIDAVHGIIVTNPDESTWYSQFCWLGNAYARIAHNIFLKLPRTFKQNSAIPHYFEITPQHRDLLVTFQFLPETLGPKGRTYCSTQQSTADFNGHSHDIRFSKDAIKAMCDRMLTMFPSEYARVAVCKDCIERKIKHSSVRLPNGEPAIVLHLPLGEGNVHLKVYRDVILNASPTTCLTYHNHVAGYSPVDLVDGVATATRFLIPGDKGTPEEHLVQSSDLEQDVKRKLLDSSACSDLNTLITTNIDLIKWCHDNGLPQVVKATPGSVRPITFTWSVA